MQCSRWLVTACLLCGAPAAAEVSVELTKAGAWLGVAGGAPCFVSRAAAALDRARLADELMRLRDSGPVVLAPRPGVVYEDIIVVMDLASQAGLVDARIGAPRELAMKFDDGAVDRRRGHCTPPSKRPPPVATPARAPDFLPDVAALARLSAEIALPPPKPQPDPATMARVVITRTTLSLDGRALGDVAALTAASGHIAALQQALAARATTTLIIQADRSLDAAFVQRVVETAAAAGFADVLFAVKAR